MNIKMNAGLFEVDDSEERKEILIKELKEFLFLMNKYKDIPILRDDLISVIPKLEKMIKNMDKSKQTR